MNKSFGYLLAANFEAVAVLLAAWFGGSYLNESMPQNFSWLPVTFAMAGIVIVHSWYVIFKVMIRLDREQRMNKKKEGT